jgi:hypothetical protein
MIEIAEAQETLYPLNSSRSPPVPNHYNLIRVHFDSLSRYYKAYVMSTILGLGKRM